MRLTHPFNAQLAHTAALWRSVCEPVANWLAQSFGRAGGTGAVLAGNRKINVVQPMPSKLLGQGRGPSPLDAAAEVQRSASWSHADAAASHAQRQPGSPGMLGMRESIGRETTQILFE